MKKLLLCMMAALVLASCGEDDSVTRPVYPPGYDEDAQDSAPRATRGYVQGKEITADSASCEPSYAPDCSAAKPTQPGQTALCNGNVEVDVHQQQHSYH